jgi:hypothetical protein
MVCTKRLVVSVVTALAVCAQAQAVHGEPWSRARIVALPDSAFAVVETTPDGRRLRHLPHHDETGAVDAAHLRAARARLRQVHWADPASADLARRHLEAHGDATTSAHEPE